jgi:monoamine oxidase
VRELGLHLDDTSAETPGGLRSNLYRFDGRRYPFARACADFAAVYPALQRDVRAARSPRGAREIDATSVADWIDARVPGGRGSQLGRLIAEAYCAEDGVDIGVVSALAMIGQLGESPRRPLALDGGSDERFKVHGGADQIAHRPAAGLPAGAVTLGAPLVGLRRRSDGSYVCGFGRGGGG